MTKLRGFARSGAWLLLLVAMASAQCTLNPASPSVTICTPANGDSVSSPVNVIAGSTDNAHPVVAMKVYLDNVAVFSVKSRELSTSLDISAGHHSITVNAWDSSGAVFKSTATIDVTGSGPAPISVTIAPQAATLASGQTQQFTSTVLNTANTAVTWSVDGFPDGNPTAGSISSTGLYTAGSSPGDHQIVATSAADPTVSDTAIVTVGAPPGCSASGAPSVTICSPASGATVTSPVHVQATAASSTAVKKFLVYVDSTLAFQALNTADIDSNLSISAGKHKLTVQFSSGGVWVKKSESITVAASPVPAPDFSASNHVFLVLEENQGFSRIFPAGNATDCTSSAMPYLCSLAAANGMALHFYANKHGSLLDYLYATSAAAWTGSPYNCSGNSCAAKGVIAGDNIVRALTAAGKTWRGYFEDMPSRGYMGGDTANYVAHHNPFIWYSDVAKSTAQQSNMFPFTRFAQDVGANDFRNFSFIAPNILHDADGNGHQSSGDLLSSADAWLNENIAPLLTTTPFQPGGDGILIIVFDEAQVAGKSGSSSTDNSCSPSQTSGCGGHVALVMVGPNVLAGSTASDTYHFQDLVHTIVHLLGLSDYMNNANGAADIALFP